MALQKLCLIAIARSMDRFSHAYSTADDGDLQRGFLLLQKIYSSELLSWVVYKGILREEHADLLFNKYLKSLETEWLSTFSSESIAEIFAKIGPTLDKVFFTAYNRNDVPWNDFICYLPNVKEIKYKEYCDNDVLRCIAKYCPKLQILNVKHSEIVSDHGLRYFFKAKKGKKRKRKREFPNPENRIACPLLTEINLRYTDVEDKGIELMLKNLPSLEKISYDNLPIVLYTLHKDDIGSPDKVKKYNLTHLDLIECMMSGNSRYEDILQVCFTVCPNLKSVYHRIEKLEHLNWCSMLTDLEDLEIYGYVRQNVSLDVSDYLKVNGGKLTSLELSGCLVSLSALEYSCLFLNRLAMNGVIIQYDETDTIPVFPNLKEFTVDSISTDNCEAVYRILRSSPVLEKLCFMTNDSLPPEAESEILICCEPLKHIDLGLQFVGLEFLKGLLIKCSNLETMVWKRFNVPAEVQIDLQRTADGVLNKPKVLIENE